MVILPQKKTSRKLRDTLGQLYAHLDSTGNPSGPEVTEQNIENSSTGNEDSSFSGNSELKEQTEMRRKVGLY
jgi:hypothetical protein